MTRSPTNTTQRHQRQYTTILTSILIIGILSIGTFISTRQFYTEVSSTTQDTNSLLQTGGTSSNSSREDNSTTSNHLRVQQKDNDDTKDLPVAEELFEGANDNDDGDKIISIAKNEDEDRDLLFEVVANNYTGSVDNVTNVEDGNMINHANDKNDDGDKIISIAKNEDEDRDLPITEELFEVVANGNHSDGSVDNVTNIGHMNNQGNESSSGEGGEQISSGKIIEEIISNDQVDDNETSSNAKDEEEEESCFRPRRYNKSKSRLSTPFINLGLPKMGSTSLHSYFRCGNYSSVHWLCSETVENGTFCGDCILESIKADLNPLLAKCPTVDSFVRSRKHGSSQLFR